MQASCQRVAYAQFDYTVYNGAITITGYSGSETNVAIPDYISSLPVTAIEGASFINASNLITLAIPATVTNIADLAFSGCPTLATLIVAAAGPAYATTNGVLFNRDQTLLVQCPEGKTGLGTMPDSVTQIRDHAFANCSLLTRVILSSNLLAIGDYAFQTCSKLTAISIPASAINLDFDPFYQCSSLTNITVDLENQNFASLSGVLFDKSSTTLVLFPPGRGGSYVIPDSVTNIAPGGLCVLHEPQRCHHSGESEHNFKGRFYELFQSCQCDHPDERPIHCRPCVLLLHCPNQRP